MAFYKDGQRVSMAFHFAINLGAMVDANPRSGGLLDIAALDVIRLMDKNFPTLSRQITFDPTGRTAPSSYSIVQPLNRPGVATPTANRYWKPDGTFSYFVDSFHSTRVNTTAFTRNADPNNGFGAGDVHGDPTADVNAILPNAMQSLPLKKGKYYFEIHVSAIHRAWNANSDSNGDPVYDGVTPQLYFAPINWNHQPAFESNIGRVVFFDAMTKSLGDANIVLEGDYQYTATDTASETTAGDIIMVAYDTNANGTNQGRVFFGINGAWGTPTSPSTMVDMDPANYTDINDSVGNNGVGAPILTGDDGSGIAMGENWAIGIFDRKVSYPGDDQTSAKFEGQIKGGTDITYTPPTGFLAH